MIFEPIGKNHIFKAWDEVKPYVSRACRKAQELTENVLADLMFKKGCILIKVKDNSGQLRGVLILIQSGDLVHVTTVSGNFEKGWLEEVESYINDLSARCRAIFITAEGRKGWVRLLIPLGWQENNGFYIKEVAYYG